MIRSESEFRFCAQNDRSDDENAQSVPIDSSIVERNDSDPNEKFFDFGSNWKLCKGAEILLIYEKRLVEVRLLENFSRLDDEDRLTISHLASIYSIPKRHLFFTPKIDAENRSVQIRTRIFHRKQLRFGFVREIPIEENFFRFLILFDDGNFLYLGRNDFFHVCLCQKFSNHLRSIEIESIREEIRKNFNSKIFEKNSFRIEQKIRVKKFGEIFHKVEILQIDCSLIKVRFFERKAQTELWIHHKSSFIEENFLQQIETISNRTENLLFPSKSIFQVHRCSSSCVYESEKFFNPNSFNQNPHNLPLACSWKFFEIDRRANGSFKRKPSTRKGHRYALKFLYRSPCGKSFLTLTEVEDFLFRTNSKLMIKFFISTRATSIDSKFRYEQNQILLNDISQGKERTPITVVNEVDRKLPENFVYGKENISRFVSIENSTSTMICCSCTDDCRDRTKCACWLKTFEQAQLNDDESILNGRRQNLSDEQILSRFGYLHQRLKTPVWSGIYECNSKCSCHRQHCNNRLVQHGLYQQLQLFHTEKKGWGLRTLHDIPPGSFINSYAGELITEEIAAQRDFKYLAILDHKSHLLTNRSERSNNNNETNDRNKSQLPMKSLHQSSMIDDDNDDPCFILDAKDYGSISRFYNHSCNPNVFVQNVFIETHDPRFPIISLFACRSIRAGEELCWDYNYTVGCMPGIRIDCQCQAANCRGRLL